MIRAIAFSLALAFGVGASPLSQNAQKEIHPTMVDIVYAAEPCPEPIILVTLAEVKVEAAVPEVKPVVKAKVKVKKKPKKKRPVLTSNQKKKFAALALQKKQKDKKTDHHKSKVPDNHKSQTQNPNNPTSHGPLHLTSPPGCG